LGSRATGAWPAINFQKSVSGSESVEVFRPYQAKLTVFKFIKKPKALRKGGDPSVQGVQFVMGKVTRS